MTTQTAALAERLRGAQRRHARALSAAAIVVLSVLAARGLASQMDNIIRNSEHGGGDLHYYFEWVRDWAQGTNIYLRSDRPEYPAASMPLLYPIVGWLEWPQVRLLMASLSLIGAGVLAAIAVKATRAASWTQAALAVLLVYSNNGTGVAIGNGQLSLLILPQVLIALLLLHRRPARWSSDLAAAALLVGALVKPSSSAPFLWLALIFPQGLRWRPILLTVAGYALVTAYSISVFDEPTIDALLAPVRHGVAIAPTSFDPNIHYVLPRVGLGPLLLPSTALAFVALGAWLWIHRRLDLWLLLAVAALVTRVWTYHRVYEDVLLLLPEIALWRLAQQRRRDGAIDVCAAVLLALNVLAVVTPARLLESPRWFEVLRFFTQGFVWATTLAFLVWYARDERRRRESERPSASQVTSGSPVLV